MIGGYSAWTYDFECFANVTMVGFHNIETGALRQFSNVPGFCEPFSALRDFWPELYDSLIIGFNSLSYDNFLLNAVLMQRLEHQESLYDLSQKTIAAGNGMLQGPRLYRVHREVSIDLFAIGAGKIGSLKELAIKLGLPRVQELPFHWSASLTPAQMQTVAEYNHNDLKVTARAAQVMAEQIVARLALTEQLQVDVVNDHDARLAERVMASRLFGDGKPTFPNRTSWRLDGRSLTEKFHFEHPELQALAERIARWDMHFELVTETRPDGSVEKTIEGSAYTEQVKVCGMTYTIGQGGLHSADEPMLFVADDRYALLDMDIVSDYPNLILNHSLVPDHLPAAAFLSEFRALLERRVQAKAGAKAENDPYLKALADGLKVSINSLFGKCGSPYSWLCSPPSLISCTLLGQLTLLSAIDRLVAMDGVEVVSANTDGLTLRVLCEHAKDVKKAMNTWAMEQNLALEWVEYSMIARRSISSYLAGGPAKDRDDDDLRFGIDGAVVIKKGKGDFSYDPADLKRKATNQIVVDAVTEFFLHGTPVADTVRACTDVTRLVDYFKCKKTHHIEDANSVNYGGIARWYRSVNGSKLDKVRDEDGQRTQLCGAGALVVNDLPTSFPSDVDWSAYVEMAEKMVAAVIDPQVRFSTTIPLSDLSLAQHELYESNLRCSEPDLERCRALDLRAYQRDFAARTRGNAYSTMSSLLPRLWLAEEGRLTRADLVWCALEIASGDDYFEADHQQRRKLAGLIDWCARTVSPFPLPQTRIQKIERALTWAGEKVERLKTRPNPNIWHRHALDSKFVNRAAIAAFDKSANDYKLACHIAATAVKNAAHIDVPMVMKMIADVEHHLNLLHGTVSDPKAQGQSPFERLAATVKIKKQTPYRAI